MTTTVPLYSSPRAYDEMDIVGHDGHMYRGRFQRKLPNIQKVVMIAADNIVYALCSQHLYFTSGGPLNFS